MKNFTRYCLAAIAALLLVGNPAAADNESVRRFTTIADHTNGNPAQVDSVGNALVGIDFAHHEIHEEDSYFLFYSVADLGAMTTPDDMITLTFTTPNTTKWGHFTFTAIGSAGWRIRLIEAPSGGAATETGEFAPLNSNRNSTNESGFIDLQPVAGSVAYDATLATGGTTLLDTYIPGDASPFASAGTTGSRDEIVLKQNTKYQASIFGAAAAAATLHLTWYEHENSN